jgi:hypothetical protein
LHRGRPNKSKMVQRPDDSRGAEVDTHGLTPVALEMRKRLIPRPTFGGFHPRPNVRGPQPKI